MLMIFKYNLHILLLQRKYLKMYEFSFPFTKLCECIYRREYFLDYKKMKYSDNSHQRHAFRLFRNGIHLFTNMNAFLPVKFRLLSRRCQIQSKLIKISNLSLHFQCKWNIFILKTSKSNIEIKSIWWRIALANSFSHLNIIESWSLILK